MVSLLNKKNVKNFFSNRKIQILTTIILFLIVLLSSMSIRLSNLDNLKDSTTGEYIPLALDPFYFLRVAETLFETGGNLPETDSMRAWALDIGWHPEIMPQVIVGMWRVASMFDSEITLRFINVISPPIFYGLALIIFFFLIYVLTKSKTASLLGSAILAYSPAYLYRTMAGFSDHESIGMVGLFSCFLLFVLGLEKFEKNWKSTVLWGTLLGFGTALTLATWGGALTFVVMIIPLVFLLYHLLKNVDELKSIGYYVTWLFSSSFFAVLFGFSFSTMINRFTNSYGLLVPFVLVFLIFDYLLSQKFVENFKHYKKKWKEAYSFFLTIIFGSVGLTFLGRNIFLMIKELWFQLMHPIGLNRVGLTVAENAQPYLKDLADNLGANLYQVISVFNPSSLQGASSSEILKLQITSLPLILFLTGTIYVGWELSKGIKKQKYRWGMVGAWVVLVSSILFSRISSSHLLNGENILSQGFYLTGILVFVGYFVWIYFKRELRVEGRTIFLVALTLIVLINARTSVRSFFLITPFIAAIGVYGVVQTYNYARKSKDDVYRILLWVLLIILILSVFFTIRVTSEIISGQAKGQGPSANIQWQGAMNWIRENTPENSVFVHWWDYGYWIQTLGERPTVTDGGHATASWGDHLIGRYVLTTDKPETAYSFMKTWNVSYLLIDQTELGKYAAYSRIGSDENWDRYSSIPQGSLDEKQTQETSEGILYVYNIQNVVDEDIYYGEIFLPGPSFDEYGRASFKSFIGGVILETNTVDGKMSLKQPTGVFVYNNQQIRIPLRYVYVNNEIVDFGSGFEAGIILMPRIKQTGINQVGGLIYLSPKTFKSLYAQVYLMDDPFERYSGLEIVHEEDSPNVASIKRLGLDIPGNVFTNGFEGPIRIYKINYPIDTETHEEFYEIVDGVHGELDNFFE